MSQVELVSYPKVHQRPDGRVELVVHFQGKRMRIQNGRSFGITLKPNSFPYSERLKIVQWTILAKGRVGALARIIKPLYCYSVAVFCF